MFPLSPPSVRTKLLFWKQRWLLPPVFSNTKRPFLQVSRQRGSSGLRRERVLKGDIQRSRSGQVLNPEPLSMTKFELLQNQNRLWKAEVNLLCLFFFYCSLLLLPTFFVCVLHFPFIKSQWTVSRSTTMVTFFLSPQKLRMKLEGMRNSNVNFIRAVNDIISCTTAHWTWAFSHGSVIVEQGRGGSWWDESRCWAEMWGNKKFSDTVGSRVCCFTATPCVR